MTLKETEIGDRDMVKGLIRTLKNINNNLQDMNILHLLFNYGRRFIVFLWFITLVIRYINPVSNFHYVTFVLSLAFLYIFNKVRAPDFRIQWKKRLFLVVFIVIIFTIFALFLDPITVDTAKYASLDGKEICEDSLCVLVADDGQSYQIYSRYSEFIIVVGFLSYIVMGILSATLGYIQSDDTDEYVYDRETLMVDKFQKYLKALSISTRPIDGEFPDEGYKGKGYDLGQE